MQEEKTLTLHSIIEEMFDFSDYSAEDKNAIIEETASMVMESALLRILSESDEKAQEAFDQFIQTEPNEDAIISYIQDNFENFEDVIAEELKILKQMQDEESEKTMGFDE